MSAKRNQLELPGLEKPRPERTRPSAFAALFGPDRWQAIESTYETAFAAESALPGVALKDVFAVGVTIRRVRGNQVIHREFCERTKHREVIDALAKRFAVGGGTQVGLTCNCEPYRPQKGEISYREWKRLYTAGPEALEEAA